MSSNIFYIKLVTPEHLDPDFVKGALLRKFEPTEVQVHTTFGELTTAECGPPTEKTTVDWDALAEHAKKLDLTSEDFDDEVHDAKSGEAADINNGGLADQIEYLYDMHTDEKLIRGLLTSLAKGCDLGELDEEDDEESDEDDDQSSN